MPVQKAASKSIRSNADDAASMQHVFLYAVVPAHVHCNASRPRSILVSGAVLLTYYVHSIL